MSLLATITEAHCGRIERRELQRRYLATAVRFSGIAVPSFAPGATPNSDAEDDLRSLVAT